MSELTHYGVLGMKWGVRKDRSGSASNYSEQQRKQDRRFYGSRAEQRIEKRLDKGENIVTARHKEVERQDRIKRTKAVAKNVGVAAFTIAGAAIVTKLIMSSDIGNKIPDAAKGRIFEQVSAVGESLIRNMFKKI